MRYSLLVDNPPRTTNTGIAALALVALLSTANGLQAATPPAFDWARSGGGLDLDTANAVATDACGNVAIVGDCGLYGGYPAYFGAKEVLCTGQAGGFATMYDREGNLLWAHGVDSPANDNVISVAFAPDGSLRVGGLLNDLGSFEASPVTASGPYVAKLDSNGIAEWATSLSPPNGDPFSVNAVAVDRDGNTLVAGQFRGTKTVGTTVLSSAGLNDILVAKLSPTGAVLWAKRAGGAGYDSPLSIAADGQDDLLLTGYIGAYSSHDAEFDGLSVPNRGGGDAFIAKYDKDGTRQWAKSMGGTDLDLGFAVAVAPGGWLFATGQFRSGAWFDTTHVTGFGGDDMYLARYSSTGALDWVRADGGNGQDIALVVAVDGGGRALVAGAFTGTCTIGPHSLVSAGAHDMFVARYTSDGNVDWAFREGEPGTEWVNGIAYAPEVAMYVSGYYEGNTTIGDDELESAGARDAFVARWSGTPRIDCRTVSLCNDPGLCAASVPCASLAVCIDGDGNEFAPECSPSGPVPVGTSAVEVTCRFGCEVVSQACPVTISDCEGPVASCRPGVNPSCADRPGPWQDGFVQATCEDNCAGATAVITAFGDSCEVPVSNGEYLKLTEAPGIECTEEIGTTGKGGPCPTRHILTPGDPTLECTDAVGFTASSVCELPPTRR